MLSLFPLDFQFSPLAFLFPKAFVIYFNKLHHHPYSLFSKLCLLIVSEPGTALCCHSSYIVLYCSQIIYLNKLNYGQIIYRHRVLLGN